MARMSEIEWEPCLLTQRPAPELEMRFERETGRPGKLMRYFEGSKWLGDTMLLMSVQLTTFVHIDTNLADQVGLVVSQDNSCRFCFGVQRAFLRVLGMSEKHIARLEQDLLTGDFNARERAALDFARRVSQSKPLTSLSDIVPLREVGFSDEEIVELAGHIAMHLFMNRMSTFVALPPKQVEQFPDQWWVRLLRPVFAVKFRSMRRRSKPTLLLDTEKSGPLSGFVNALDGLPIARGLRTTIDRLWTSSSLPPRTISLLFAVVGRALGSPACEHEAREMLREQGFAKAEIDQILTHLSSPALSEIEQLLVPLARETVWYQPVQIQRRFAALQSKVSNEQFLDFLGAVSLMNSLCRLRVIFGLRA